MGVPGKGQARMDICTVFGKLQLEGRLTLLAFRQSLWAPRCVKRHQRPSSSRRQMDPLEAPVVVRLGAAAACLIGRHSALVRPIGYLPTAVGYDQQSAAPKAVASPLEDSY